jgi:sodium/proline symporter
VTLFAILIALAALLAVWGAYRARDAVGYFAAGRRAGTWLVGIAGTAVGVSAFTFVGGPGLFAVAGVGSLWIILSAPLTGALQCWAIGEPVVALASTRPIVTVPELLQARHGPAAQGAGAGVLVAGCVAMLAVQARAAAVLGEDLLHLPGSAAALATMLATVVYTAAGGMRAGLLADAVQGAVMGVVAMLLAGLALHAAGGPAAAVATLRDARPELLGSFGTVPQATAFAWYLLFCLGTLAQPHYVQKFLFLRDRSALRALPAVLTLGLAVTLTVWLGVGLAGTALVVRGELVLARPDDLAPRVLAILGPGAALAAGLAVLAALMSTSASFLNMAAAAVTRDLPSACGRPPRGLGAARAATVGVALAATAVGILSSRAVALLGVAGWGFFTAALLPALTLGRVWPRARASAVVAAMIAGATVDLGLEAVRAGLPAGLEPGLAGAAAGTLVLVALSILRPSSTDPRPPTPEPSTAGPP